MSVTVSTSEATPSSALPDKAILLSKQVSSGQQKPIKALFCIAALLAQPGLVTTVEEVMTNVYLKLRLWLLTETHRYCG